MINGIRLIEYRSECMAIGIVDRTSPAEYAHSSHPVSDETLWYDKRSSWNGKTGMMME